MPGFLFWGLCFHFLEVVVGREALLRHGGRPASTATTCHARE